MNKKLIAGLAAIALFCGSIPAYNAFLTETSISASAEDADIAAFLKGYTSMDNKVSIAGDIPIAGRTYAQGIQFSGVSGTAYSVSYDVSEIGSLSFTAGHVDGSGSGTATLTVYLDGVKADECTVPSYQTPEKLLTQVFDACNGTFRSLPSFGGVPWD